MIAAGAPGATTLRGWVLHSEWRALWASAAAHFCLLAGYYMLRSLREGFVLQAGRSHIAALFYLVTVVMFFVLPVYWWLVARLPRRWLFPVIYGAVALLMVALAIGLQTTPGSRTLAGAFFVAVNSVNLFIISVFWSVMADVWKSISAKRIFGFIAAGGSAGALAGPAFNALFVETVGPITAIYIACALLLLAAVFGVWAQRLRAVDTAAPAARLDGAVGGLARDDLKRLASSKYMLAIAAVIVIGQTLGALMYNEQAKYVESAFATLEARTALFAQVDLWVSILSLVLQATVVGWLAARGSMKLALTAVPVIVGASFLWLALAPVGAVLLATQIVRRSTEYGLSKPTREMLFTILNPESKFKSKSLIDTVLHRGGDSFGNAVYQFMANGGLAFIASVATAVSALLLLASLWLANAFTRQEVADSAEALPK